MSPTRFAPYRKIVGEEWDGVLEVEVLSCGHKMRPREDMIGQTYPERRRCVECLMASCSSLGHPLVDWFMSAGEPSFNGRTFMRCQCTERTG